MDITTVPTGIIAHGCNTSGGFGSGVAGAICSRFPKAALAHKNSGVGSHLLGTVQFVDVSDNKPLWVANCYTQELFGADGEVYADTLSITKSLMVVYQHARFSKLDVFLPLIGCKRGGLSWDVDVEPIVDHLDRQYSGVGTTICLWDG
jgi:O-acetyl-ADP-ribose deacetylase (regulator of RNase III)